MSRRLISIVACLALCGVAYTLAPAQQPDPVDIAPKRAKWEYKVLSEVQVNDLGAKPGPQGGPFALRATFADGMKQLGDDGWELVIVTTGQGPAVYHFKRPK